jgi:hypothetical protein
MAQKPKAPNGFTTNLNDLDRLGKVVLPGVVEQLHGTERVLRDHVKVGRSNFGDCAPVWHSDHDTPGGPWGSVTTPSSRGLDIDARIEACVDDLASALSKGIGIMTETCDAIVEIARVYRIADGQS